jgi:hypothetical protein
MMAVRNNTNLYNLISKAQSNDAVDEESTPYIPTYNFNCNKVFPLKLQLSL